MGGTTRPSKTGPKCMREVNSGHSSGDPEANHVQTGRFWLENEAVLVICVYIPPPDGYTRTIRGSTCRVKLWSKYLYVWILLLSNSHSFYFNKHVRCIIIIQSGPNTAQRCEYRWAAKWFENIVFAPLNPALKQPSETETLGGWLFSQYLPPPGSQKPGWGPGSQKHAVAYVECGF